MNHRFRIGILQKRSSAFAYEENTRAVLSAMGEAKESGADFLLLPECFLTGYSLPCNNEKALSLDSAAFQAVRRRAKELSLGVAATALMKGRKRPTNSAVVIDRQGEVLMRYDKVHTCDFSLERCLEHGREFSVCSFDGICLGVMICYDREYPESARVLMLKGAEIILVPNDCGCMRPRLRALETRAYENMTGVVMANPPGRDAGCSCAFSPVPWDEEGNCKEMCLLQAGPLEEGLFYVDYDMEQLRRYRSSEMMGNTFRKVEAYGELLHGEVKEPFLREPF